MPRSHRRLLLLIIGLLSLANLVIAQSTSRLHPAKGQSRMQTAAAQRRANPALDRQLGRYYEDNQRLLAQPAPPDRVVFLGDSITDFWKLPEYFPGKPYVNRGISGQATSQMLLRMFPDVIDLHPAVVIVKAGTNDIAYYTGPETLTAAGQNIRAMTELARLHGIRVILGSIIPVSDYSGTKRTVERSPAHIVEWNMWLRGYATGADVEFADYYSVMVDEQGMLRKDCSDDGVHPNARGYTLMAPLAEAAIQRVLQRPTSAPCGQK